MSKGGVTTTHLAQGELVSLSGFHSWKTHPEIFMFTISSTFLFLVLLPSPPFVLLDSINADNLLGIRRRFFEEECILSYAIVPAQERRERA